MISQSINEFPSSGSAYLAEQNVQQAKRAFDKLMAATQRTILAFEGQTASAQSNAREVQRKVIAYSEREVAASLEFAQKLPSANDAEAMMALHANHVKGQMQALTSRFGTWPNRLPLRRRRAHDPSPSPGNCDQPTAAIGLFCAMQNICCIAANLDILRHIVAATTDGTGSGSEGIQEGGAFPADRG
jgi:hypothetical protein